MDYQKGQKFPSLITKKIKELEFYDNEVILKAFQDYENDIIYWMNHKNFTSSVGKIGYMFAIVNNHINDIYDQWKRDKKQTIKEEKSTIDICDNTAIEDLGTNVKGKDISEWLEDD